MRIPLFDIDGTLFKTANPVHFDAFSYMFKNIYGVDANQREIKPEGMLDNQIIIDVLKLRGFSEKKVKEKLKDAATCMSDYVVRNIKKDSFIPLPGVKDLLEKLKLKKVPLGILSGNMENIAWAKIENAGLISFFNFGAFGNEAFKRVDLVEIAKNKANKIFNSHFKTDNFIIIGDTPRDIACARNAEIQVIAVSTGIYPFEELTDEKPDLMVHNLGEKSVLEFIIN